MIRLCVKLARGQLYITKRISSSEIKTYMYTCGKMHMVSLQILSMILYWDWHLLLTMEIWLNLPFTWFSYQERKNLVHSIHAKMDIMIPKKDQILHPIAQWILISGILVIETCRFLKRWIKKKYKIFSYKNHCRIHNLILMYIWKNRNQGGFISWHQTKTIFFLLISLLEVPNKDYHLP